MTGAPSPSTPSGWFSREWVRRRWPAVGGMVCGLVCLSVAAVYALVPAAPPPLPSDIGVVPGESDAGALGDGAPAGAELAPGQARVRRLVIPVLDVEAGVRPVVVGRDGGLGLPDNPREVGWWSEGAGPGTGLGSVVLAGHVDDEELGRGALYHLSELLVGDLIWVETSVGRRTYRVAARRVYRKATLPGEVFAQAVPERLVLITCTSPYDRSTRTYAANVVVYAAPVSN